MPVVRSTVNLPAGGTAKVTVTIRLITSSPAVPGYTATGEIIGRTSLNTIGGSAWSTTLVGNADITPAGTYYEVTEAVPGTGEKAVSLISVPSAGGPYTLGELLAADPPAPASLGSTKAYVDTQVGAEAVARAAADTAMATTVGGKLAKAANLSDVPSPPTARGNLGLGSAAVANIGTTAGTVAAGNDARLTDARTPTGHHTTHESGGSDPLTLAQSQITGLGTALGAKADLVAGKLDPTQLPDLAIVAYLGPSVSQAAMLALVGQQGDWTIRTDLGTMWWITGSPTSSLSSWTQASYPTSPVTSVATKTGAITLVSGDVGLGNVDNTSDATKPISAAQAAVNTAQTATNAAQSATNTGLLGGVALVQSNTHRLITKMVRAQEDAAMLVISDSTAAITTRWVYVSAVAIAAMFPAWTVIYHLWDPTGGAAYDTGGAGTPTTIQTGTGARTLHVWNMSVTGKQTSYCLAGRYALGIVPTNPDLIVVSHGKNEQNPTADAETNRALWRGQMLALTERVSSTFPTAGILLTLQHRNTADNLMALRNRVYEEVAAMRGFGIVPVFDAFEATGHPNDFIRSDGIHPTDATDPAAPAPTTGQTTPARDGVALWVLTFMQGFTYEPTGKISAQAESAFVQIAEQACPNGNFAAFTSAVPDSWTATGCTTTKDVRAGWFESTNGYAVRIQATSAVQSFIDQFVPNATTYRGKVMTLRVRARVAAAALTTATGLRVGLSDGVSTTTLSYTKIDAVDGFFDTIVSLRMATAATYLRVLIYADTAANSTADITVDTVHLTAGLLPRRGSSGAVGPQGVAGPVAAAFDHLSTMGTNPALSYAANTPFVLGGANQGIAVPVIPNRNMTPIKLTWLPGVVSGNYDVAVLDASGNRLWSKGLTAVSSGVKTETVSGVNLVVGTTYYLILTFDNTTAQVYGLSAQYELQGRLATGVAWARTISTVCPVPSTVTLGTVGSAKIPLMTLTEA